MATKGYGLTVNDIDQSCPTDLEPYVKAYEMRKNIKDSENWQLGQYILAAISTVFLEKSKYPKKPMFQVINSSENGYKDSQEEIAVFEMKQRTKLLEKSGLMESPM